ncbi:MAG: homocysteine S-methyltransferase [Ilumatobacteraceae bacterium]
MQLDRDPMTGDSRPVPASSRRAPLVAALTRDGALPFAVLDGGLSTSLESLGERPAGALWTAQTLLERPHVVTAAHRLAVEAGADVVISASYQASEDGFVAAGLERARARTLLHGTTAIARASGARLVAASVGPYGACRADGSEYHGRYDVSWDDVRSFHRRRLEVLVDSGPDLVAIETVPTAAEASIVVEELRRLSPVPAWVSFSCRDGWTTCGGDSMGAALRAVDDGVELVGVNCTAPAHVASLLEALTAARTSGGTGNPGPWVVYPNHGAAWDAEGKCWVGADGGREPAASASSWWDRGALLIGGCCGVGPSAIADLARCRDAIAASRSTDA